MATSPDWHQALLQAMGLEIDGVRPEVLSGASVAAFREVISFRHFFRHVYAVELDPARFADVRRAFVASASELDAEVTAFDAFLAQVADTDR